MTLAQYQVGSPSLVVGLFLALVLTFTLNETGPAVRKT
jgi:hypothetical protein